MWLLLLMVGLLCCSGEGQVTCRDENNGMVDWYILYKRPELKPEPGLEYMYIDSSGVRKGNELINDPNGILANTLRPILKPTSSMTADFGFISYSDQHARCNKQKWSDPDVKVETSAAKPVGHSKGVVMLGGATGLWLLHTVPQFPLERDQNHFYPTSGAVNGQSFICVTFNRDQFDKIGEHLQYIAACVFDKHIPDQFPRQLINAANGVRDHLETTLVQLTSRGNQVFYSIAKPQATTAADGDLYVLISEAISSDLKAQTWGRQPGRDRSFCHGQYKVINVQRVSTPLGTWKASSDHSKWCVATDVPWTCIADMNRAPTQYERPGGALCINNKAVRDTFRSFVNQEDDCPNFITAVAGKVFDFLQRLVQSSLSRLGG